MDTLYQKKEDGSLQPLEYPPILVKQVEIYKWLQSKGLNLEDIKFLTSGGIIPFLTRD